MSSLELQAPPQAPQASTQTLATVMKFVLSAVTAAVAIVGGGWMTSLTTMMYGASLTLLTFAALPFALILLGIALPFLVAGVLILITLMSFVVALFAGDGGAIAPEGSLVLDSGVAGFKIARYGARLRRPYYRWLSRTRHPIFWGTVAGSVLGTGILWTWVTGIVLPGEARTVQILATTRETLIKRYNETKQLPPAKDGQLLYKDLAMDVPGPVVDGFGQPLQYEADDSGFQIRSRGFDRRLGSDDLAAAGQVERPTPQKLSRWGSLAKAVAKKLDITSIHGLEFKIEDGKVKVAAKIGLRNAAKMIMEFRSKD